MQGPSTAEIEQILAAANAGDGDAAERLWELLYAELRRLARLRMGKLPPGQTLQSTALVHEAYLKVVGGADSSWDSPEHFISAAARAMRNILVDRARSRDRIKHGGGVQRVSLSHAELFAGGEGPSLLVLDVALERLAAHDERAAHIVNLRYFGGLSIDDVAHVTQTSHATVERSWAYAKAWLKREVEREGGL